MAWRDGWQDWQGWDWQGGWGWSWQDPWSWKDESPWPQQSWKNEETEWPRAWQKPVEEKWEEWEEREVKEEEYGDPPWKPEGGGEVKEEVKEEEEEEQALEKRAGTKMNNTNRLEGTGTVSHARRARFQAAAMTREVRAMEHEDRLGREWLRKVFGTSLVQVKKEEKSPDFRGSSSSGLGDRSLDKRERKKIEQVASSSASAVKVPHAAAVCRQHELMFLEEKQAAVQQQREAMEKAGHKHWQQEKEEECKDVVMVEVKEEIEEGAANPKP